MTLKILINMHNANPYIFKVYITKTLTWIQGQSLEGQASDWVEVLNSLCDVLHIH